MTGPFAPLFLTGIETYFQIGFVVVALLLVYVAAKS